MKFNIACGMDNATLNPTLAQVHSALYPLLLKHTITIGQMGIESIEFDINQPPTVQLSPSETARDYFIKALDENKYGPTAELPPEHKKAIVELATAASFKFTAPSVALAIYYPGGKPHTTAVASLQGTATIQTGTKSGQNYLEFQIMSATADVKDNPVLSALLNNAFMPLLIPYLNQKVLSKFKVPTLKYGSLHISMPVPAVQTPFLTAYAALGGTQPDIPAPLPWPSGCIFFASDTTTLTAAAALPFPLGPHTGFSWEVIDGEVGARLLAPNNISVGGDGSINASIQAEAVCRLTLHTPNYLPNVSFGPKGTVRISASLKPTVKDGKMSVVIKQVSIPSFRFDWGIPSWIEWFFYPLTKGLEAALNAILSPLISKILENFSISIMDMPTISFDIEGKPIKLHIKHAHTSGMNSMLVVHAQVSVSGAAIADAALVG